MPCAASNSISSATLCLALRACAAATCGHITTSPSRPGTPEGSEPPSSACAPPGCGGRRSSLRQASTSGAASSPLPPHCHSFLPHPANVQLRHRGLVHEQPRKLGERMHAHLVEHVPGQPGQGSLVHSHPGLVRDLHAHAGHPELLNQGERLPVTAVIGSCWRR